MLVKNINYINQINKKPLISTSFVSFKGGEDSFVKIPRLTDGTLAEQEINEIIETINNQEATCKGYSSNVFNIDNKKIIKMLKREKRKVQYILENI